MTVSTDDGANAQIASVLWAARQNGACLEASLVTTLSLSRAYAVQRRYLQASECEVTGVKLGATPVASQAMLGPKAPFVGPVLHGTSFGAAASSPIPAHPVFPEVELCLRLDEAPAIDVPAFSVSTAIELDSGDGAVPKDLLGPRIRRWSLPMTSARSRG